MTKNKNSSHLFDDGLLIKFELQKPEHLTFYCRTLNKDKDTCNVKLFKLGSMDKTRTAKEKKWKPPLTRNETVLFFRMGYFNYVKVNYEINDHLEV